MARQPTASSGSAPAGPAALPVEIVADLTCPWCYIGTRRLERALAMRPHLPVERVWRPFQLAPDLPPEGLPYSMYLQLKFGGRSIGRIQAALAAAGERDGIAFAFDRIRSAPNTLHAHRLIRFAAVQGCADVVAEALFRGYFTEGLDIGEPAALATIAAECGLDPKLVRGYLARGIGTAEVLEAEHRARRSGIDAVPCFIIGGEYALAGAQDAEMFLPLFDLAVAPPVAVAD